MKIWLYSDKDENHELLLEASTKEQAILKVNKALIKTWGKRGSKKYIKEIQDNPNLIKFISKKELRNLEKNYEALKAE